MFVSPDDVFLWVSPGYEELDWQDDCTAAARPLRRDVLPGAVFRVPVRGGAPGVVGVSGRPFDQFSMDSQKGEFRALAEWRTFRCERLREQPLEVAFLKIPHALFTTALAPLDGSRVTAVPSPGKRIVENRFADDWLVYGGRDSWGAYPPDEDAPPQSALAVVVPVAHPRRARTLSIPHNIIRTERVGDDMVLNGYRDQKGLNVTMLSLEREPRIASTLLLERRFESEGRSHAFNSIVDESGSGVIGVPTVLKSEGSGRWWWRSDSSDLSFVTLDTARRLASAGALLAGEERAADESYQCEVSCIDWYGNSRPIFTDGRIFGLMGTDLVEARLDRGQIAEVRRLDLTEPVATERAPR